MGVSEEVENVVHSIAISEAYISCLILSLTPCHRSSLTCSRSERSRREHTNQSFLELSTRYVLACRAVFISAQVSRLILHSEDSPKRFPYLCKTITGVPTPDPALLVEMAPPDNGSPTNLKWKFPTHAPVGVDSTKDASLQWNFPKGQPTPDPALLTDVSDKVTWGYPPGVPTPGKQ